MSLTSQQDVRNKGPDPDRPNPGIAFRSGNTAGGTERIVSFN